MSKSKQHKQKQAPWRRGQSLPLEPLDTEPRFIDDLMGWLVVPLLTRHQYPTQREFNLGY